MKIGFYAGSFDPFTIGHLYIVKTASNLFDKLVVGIGINENKTRRFDKQKMKLAIENVFEAEKLTNVEVVIYDGFTVHAAKEKGASFLVRGIRNSADFEIEKDMAETNKSMLGIETVFFGAGDFGMVSSTMVCELLKEGKDVSKYLPPQILEIVK